ncbi:uncharacterized protein V2V93DRAFT_128913 [Kockiozyma suomiensis]|uniref:uncharacterized protein n=1 Tax=Kockiozyma suomiensis TaxID=1337062 RepID=UPI00334381B5
MVQTVLRASYSIKRNPTCKELESLANLCGLKRRQVTFWFANQRSRSKKQSRSKKKVPPKESMKFTALSTELREPRLPTAQDLPQLCPEKAAVQHDGTQPVIPSGCTNNVLDQKEVAL